MNFTFSKAKCVGNLLQSLHVNELYTGFFLSLCTEICICAIFGPEQQSLIYL